MCVLRLRNTTSGLATGLTVLRVRERNEAWADYIGSLLTSKYGTPTELARVLDVSTSTVPRWLDGSTPQRPALQKMAERTGIPIGELLLRAGYGTADLAGASSIPLEWSAELEVVGPRDNDAVFLPPNDQDFYDMSLDQLIELRDRATAEIDRRARQTEQPA